MNCSNVKQHLIFYLDNTLNDQESAQLSEHLQQCESCNAQYLKLQQSMQLIPQLKVINPNPYLFSRIEAKLQQSSQTSERRIPTFIRVFNTTLVTVLLLATAFTGYYLYSGNYNTSTTTNTNDQSNSIIAGQYEMGVSQQDVIETYYFTEE